MISYSFSYLRLSRWSDEEDDYEDEPELISTEGCFACQMNGGTRRRAGRWILFIHSRNTLICELTLITVRRRGRSKRSTVDAFLEAITGEEREEKVEAKTDMKADHDGKVVQLDLRLTPRQTRHRRKVVRIQPATTYMQHDVDYKVQMRLIN